MVVVGSVFYLPLATLKMRVCLHRWLASMGVPDSDVGIAPLKYRPDWGECKLAYIMASWPICVKRDGRHHSNRVLTKPAWGDILQNANRHDRFDAYHSRKVCLLAPSEGSLVVVTCTEAETSLYHPQK
jgi:hypothetical protein